MPACGLQKTFIRVQASTLPATVATCSHSLHRPQIGRQTRLLRPVVTGSFFGGLGGLGGSATSAKTDPSTKRLVIGIFGRSGCLTLFQWKLTVKIGYVCLLSTINDQAGQSGKTIKYSTDGKNTINNLSPLLSNEGDQHLSNPLSLAYPREMTMKISKKINNKVFALSGVLPGMSQQHCQR